MKPVLLIALFALFLTLLPGCSGKPDAPLLTLRSIEGTSVELGPETPLTALFFFSMSNPVALGAFERLPDKIHGSADTVGIVGDTWTYDGADWTASPRIEERLNYRRDGIGWSPLGYRHVFVVPVTGGTVEMDVSTDVAFRHLERDEIERYVSLDEPLDCAGSFRSEANGPALLDYMRSDDPTAIMGLPMIELSKGLRAGGVRLP